jgi:hypothetical protein
VRELQFTLTPALIDTLLLNFNTHFPANDIVICVEGNLFLKQTSDKALNKGINKG